MAKKKSPAKPKAKDAPAPKKASKATPAKEAPKKTTTKKPAAPKKKAPAKKAAPVASKAVAPVTLSAAQAELLQKISAAAAPGYLSAKKGEQRSIDALAGRKLVKKGAKDKASGQHHYLVSSAGQKHLGPQPAPVAAATPAAAPNPAPAVQPPATPTPAVP